MKVIQCVNDIEALKAYRRAPQPLIQAIEQDFIDLYEASGKETSLLAFFLPYDQALILLEKEDDVMAQVDDPFTLEYVERHHHGDMAFYRIAKRWGHEFQLFYTLVGIHDESTEQWLLEQADWNEGRGDFYV
ncbi:hypothetical protein GGR02_002886 [Anoxybacillus voinovskiensis]|uniref:Uncharacterized protein n=1 Tax=Anoxybacteroides voinovskiense TaxID=230470 RepID=A0A840DU34_9BACL|nr:hypothetical protein [Anoxybacillus voinovskiensis]MBB4075085.1 hypothetical protein [Anoxybacillus voinovskiensis]GGJ76720.1 hypothetical protein GCM10008982_27520 [Anoxybacillus voinovskiensis]